MIMRFEAKNVAPRNQAPPVEETTMRAIVQDRYGPAEALGRHGSPDPKSPTMRYWYRCTLPVSIGGHGIS